MWTTGRHIFSCVQEINGDCHAPHIVLGWFGKQKEGRKHKNQNCFALVDSLQKLSYVKIKKNETNDCDQLLFIIF